MPSLLHVQALATHPFSEHPHTIDNNMGEIKGRLQLSLWSAPLHHTVFMNCSKFRCLHLFLNETPKLKKLLAPGLVYHTVIQAIFQYSILYNEKSRSQAHKSEKSTHYKGGDLLVGRSPIVKAVRRR